MRPSVPRRFVPDVVGFFALYPAATFGPDARFDLYPAAIFDIDARFAAPRFAADVGRPLAPPIAARLRGLILDTSLRIPLGMTYPPQFSRRRNFGIVGQHLLCLLRV